MISELLMSQELEFENVVLTQYDNRVTEVLNLCLKCLLKK